MDTERLTPTDPGAVLLIAAGLGRFVSDDWRCEMIQRIDEMLPIVQSCMEQLEWIDDIQLADEKIQQAIAYLRVANAALDAVEGLITVPENDREVWEACCWISLQTLMGKIPSLGYRGKKD